VISHHGRLVKVAGFDSRPYHEEQLNESRFDWRPTNAVRIVTQRRISKLQVTNLPVSDLGKIALVTLVHSSNEDLSDSAELIAQIRDKLRLSRITKQWSIEKITILDEPPSKSGIQRTSQENDLTVP